jgi:hypothetical protein
MDWLKANDKKESHALITELAMALSAMKEKNTASAFTYIKNALEMTAPKQQEREKK